MLGRRFAAYVLAATLAASLFACGEDGKPDRAIAFVRTAAVVAESQDALLEVLAAEGWEVGDNLTVLNRDPSAVAADQDEVTEAVAGFVDDGADLIVALSTTAALGAVAAAGDVPVLVLTNDPVESGLVANPRSPEGNVTGVAFRVPADRTIDVARRLVGGTDAVGLLWPADDPGAAPIVEAVRDVGEMIGVEVVDASFAGPEGVAAAVEAIADAGVAVALIASAPATVGAFDEIERATVAAGLPVVANTNVAELAVAVLAPDALPAYRQLGRQAARILDGTEIADVPVEDPGGFRLLLRDRVAERVGLSIPNEVREQADAIE